MYSRPANVKMAGATPGMDLAVLPRIAAQLSRCFRTGVVPAEVADPLRGCFPEALLLRCLSIPSQLIWGARHSKQAFFVELISWLTVTIAILRSVSVPSAGLEDDLLISLGNFLDTGFPKVSLTALRTSVAGRCYTSNSQVECPHTAEQPGHQARWAQNPPYPCRCPLS